MSEKIEASSERRGPKAVNLFNRLVMSFDFSKPHDWRYEAVNLREWRVWDRRQRQLAGPFGGLRFWSKTNVPGSRVLVSRHWAHRLCWDWSVWLSMYRAGYDGPRKLALIIDRRARFALLDLAFFNVRWSWQNSPWMIAGPLRATGPKIIWARQLRDAEPVGSA